MIWHTDTVVSQHPFQPMRARGSVRFGPARHLMPWSTLLLGLLMLIFAGRARADCYYSSGTAATVSFTPPATITVSPDTAVGTVLWTSAPVTAPDPLVLNCSGTNSSGIVNSAGITPMSGTLFPTGIPWLSYQVLYPDSTHVLQPYANETIGDGSGTAISLDAGYALQLVVSGPVASGGTLSGPLGVWQMIYDTCEQYNNGGNCPTPRWVAAMHALATFLTSSVTFVLPTCKTAVDPTVVTLPTVYTSAFTGVGSTTGTQPFNVQLNCPSATAGAGVAITLTTNSPASGPTGVIAPTSGSGYAQNVGVQVLDTNANPIPFDTPIPAGTLTAGSFNIPLNARYYQTGTPVAGGNVSATATYTITYQ